jgi:hypothetical protein
VNVFIHSQNEGFDWNQNNFLEFLMDHRRKDLFQLCRVPSSLNQAIGNSRRVGLDCLLRKSSIPEAVIREILMEWCVLPV